jgi:hypothetical protein
MAAIVNTEKRAAVPAAVEVDPDLAGLIPLHDDRILAHIAREVVAIVGNK